MVDRLIVVALFDRVDLLDVTGPPEVFSLLQRELREPSGYRVVLAANRMDPVITSAGVRVLPDATFAQITAGELGEVDTLVVPGAVEIDRAGSPRATADPVVVEWVSALAPHTRRIASVCVGAHVLAHAGLLEGRRATTHWSTAEQLAAEHPGVRVDPDPIFIREGNIWTGAGLTACLDLALALVADDFGSELALRVARNLVMFLKRPGGQSQFSVALHPVSGTGRVHDLRLFVAANLHRPLSVAELGRQAHLSERQLTRVFSEELGMTPAAYVASARLEAARNRLESTDETLERIGASCGYGSPDSMTRAFKRALGVTPAEYRARFRLPNG